MSSSATQKKTHTDAIPSIVGTWALKVVHDPDLGMLDSIEITAQVQSGDHDSIFGSVKGGLLVTAYALENGLVTSNAEVSFDVTNQGIVYTFTGQVDGTTIKGSVTHPPETGDEEGSWSAQAQGGPGEEEEKKHPRKHTKRSAR
jgi:hypothetical protein